LYDPTGANAVVKLATPEELTGADPKLVNVLHELFVHLLKVTVPVGVEPADEGVIFGATVAVSVTGWFHVEALGDEVRVVVVGTVYVADAR
jgi:hypothetical protein